MAARSASRRPTICGRRSRAPWSAPAAISPPSPRAMPASTKSTRNILREFAMRREGSAFSGVGTVTMKELADNLTSTRMRLLELLILVTGASAAYSTIGVVKDQLSEYPFVFLLVFTAAHEPLPSFVAFLGFLIPIVAIALGFDAVNSEFNRRTMSRILAQPIYRDALLR